MQTKELSIVLRRGILAGDDGIEPSHIDFKDQCLTTWLIPNNKSECFFFSKIMVLKFKSLLEAFFRIGTPPRIRTEKQELLRLSAIIN